jgi:hypothetical protein
LCNDTNDDEDNDNKPTNLRKLREPITRCVKRDKERNHKKGSVENKVHKVLILGDIHARVCALEEFCDGHETDVLINSSHTNVVLLSVP